jgi:hypothetical protein
MDRAGRFFRVDQQIQALSRPDLQAAADELLDGCARTSGAGSTTTSPCCWPSSSSPTPARHSSLPRQASGPAQTRQCGPHNMLARLSPGARTPTPHTAADILASIPRGYAGPAYRPGIATTRSSGVTR